MTYRLLKTSTLDTQLAVVANVMVMTVDRDLVLTLVKLMLACRRYTLVNVVQHRRPSVCVVLITTGQSVLPSNESLQSFPKLGRNSLTNKDNV